MHSTDVESLLPPPCPCMSIRLFTLSISHAPISAWMLVLNGPLARWQLADDPELAQVHRSAGVHETSPIAGSSDKLVLVGEALGGGGGRGGGAADAEFPDLSSEPGSVDGRTRWHVLSTDNTESQLAMVAMAGAHGDYARWLLREKLNAKQGDTLHYCLRACIGKGELPAAVEEDAESVEAWGGQCHPLLARRLLTLHSPARCYCTGC